jgi:hypothetical protein
MAYRTAGLSAAANYRTCSRSALDCPSLQSSKKTWSSRDGPEKLSTACEGNSTPTPLVLRFNPSSAEPIAISTSCRVSFVKWPITNSQNLFTLSTSARTASGSINRRELLRTSSKISPPSFLSGIFLSKYISSKLNFIGSTFPCKKSFLESITLLFLELVGLIVDRSSKSIAVDGQHTGPDVDLLPDSCFVTSIIFL